MIDQKIYTLKAAERFYVLKILGPDESPLQRAIDLRGSSDLWPRPGADVHLGDYGASADGIEDDMPPDEPDDPIIW